MTRLISHELLLSLNSPNADKREVKKEECSSQMRDVSFRASTVVSCVTARKQKAPGHSLMTMRLEVCSRPETQ